MNGSGKQLIFSTEESMTTFWMLVGMIILGILSALLSYYKKNYYVRVFNDILGKEEDPNVAAKVGRGFWYGFWFPVYFSLLLTGLIALIAFLIVAGIIAAIVFILVWITEKILPKSAVGNLATSLFNKIGFHGAPAPPEPIEETTAPYAAATSAEPASDTSATEPSADK
jgi:hypothetical protein